MKARKTIWATARLILTKEGIGVYILTIDNYSDLRGYCFILCSLFKYFMPENQINSTVLE